MYIHETKVSVWKAHPYLKNVIISLVWILCIDPMMQFAELICTELYMISAHLSFHRLKVFVYSFRRLTLRRNHWCPPLDVICWYIDSSVFFSRALMSMYFVLNSVQCITNWSVVGRKIVEKLCHIASAYNHKVYSLVMIPKNPNLVIIILEWRFILMSQHQHCATATT